MVFWAIVGVVVIAVLVFAWRADRRRKVSIDRRNPDVENDVAQAWLGAEIHRTNGGGGDRGI
jgi:hypothetical protein